MFSNPVSAKVKGSSLSEFSLGKNTSLKCSGYIKDKVDAIL